LSATCPEYDQKGALFTGAHVNVELVATVITLVCFCVNASLYDEQRWSGVVCAVVLASVSGITVVVLHRLRKRAASEYRDRLRSIATAVRTMGDPGLSPATTGAPPSASHAFGVERGCPLTGIVPVYRNERWTRLPLLLTVQGDVVALMAGDSAPVKCQTLPIMGSQASPLILHEGERLRPRNSAPFAHRAALHEESVELLRMSGDVTCYELLQTPAEVYFPRALDELVLAHRDTLRRSIIEIRFARHLNRIFAGWIAVLVFMVTVDAIRLVVNEGYGRAIPLLVTRPATATLAFCFPNLRLLYFLLECTCTAQVSVRGLRRFRVG
jgi:hypothetical protein